MIKAGVLYPQSHIYPLIGSDLLDGIRCSLNEHQVKNISLQTEAIGFGTDEKDIYHKTEKLLLTDKVDVVIGFMDHRLARLLQPLFTATEKLFIVVNTGANYPPNWAPPPGTVFISLMDSFLCRLCGNQAFADGFAEAIFTASFYDGGYLHASTMVNGYLSGGGNIIYNYISPQKNSGFNLSPLQEKLETIDKPSAIFCLYSGEESGQFAAALAKQKNARLYCSPLMLEEQNYRTRLHPQKLYCKGLISWHSTLVSVENDRFLQAFKSETKQNAGIFSLLGWEAGLVLNAASELMSEPSATILKHLLSLSFSSPRGNAAIDPATHFLLAPIYEFDNEGKETIRVREAADMSKKWEEFVRTEKEVPASGWNNTYPCY